MCVRGEGKKKTEDWERRVEDLELVVGAAVRRLEWTGFAGLALPDRPLSLAVAAQGVEMCVERLGEATSLGSDCNQRPGDRPSLRNGPGTAISSVLTPHPLSYSTGTTFPSSPRLRVQLLRSSSQGSVTSASLQRPACLPSDSCAPFPPALALFRKIAASASSREYITAIGAATPAHWRDSRGDEPT